MHLNDCLYRAAAAIALACAAALGLHAQAQSTAIARGGRLGIPLGEFCEPTPYESMPVAIVGPRLVWMRGLPAAQTPSSIARAASEHPRMRVAASSRWLAIHDEAAGKILRADCETGEVDTFDQREPLQSLAVSAFGDIAEQLQNGRTLIRPRQITGDTGFDLPVKVPGIRGDGPRAIAWAGRRLVVVTRTVATIVDVADSNQSSPPPPVALDLRADPAAAFVYNGLTYVANGGCVDILVGPSLTPRLPRAACVPQGVPTETLLAVTRDAMSVLTGRGDVINQFPRPTVVDAKLSGTTYDITSSLLRLMEYPVVDRVPLPFGRDPGGAATTPGAWGTLVSEQYWRSRDGFERMLRAVPLKGWTDLRQDGNWYTGNGVAVTWRSGVSYIAPQGRSVDELARLTDQKEFSDAQVRGIIVGNSQLGETLEGFLIESGWVPIGAFYTIDGTAPPALLFPNSPAKYIDGASADPDADMRGRLLPTGACRVAEKPQTDALMGAFLRKGIRVLGTMEQRISEATILRADEMLVHTCGGGPSLLQVAELKNVYAGSPMSQQGLSRPPLSSVVAVRGFPTAVADKLVRSWLDRVLRSRTDLRTLLLPTTSLELMFVLNAKTPVQSLRIPGVQLTSAEAAPAAARASNDPCKIVANALGNRVRDEQMIGLQVQFQNRALTPPLKIAVAENAVPLLSPLFTRDNKSVWVEPKELGGFDSVQPPLRVDPTTRQTRFLKHGTQVAGILFTSDNGPIRGVLSDVPLVWIDTASSPSESVPTLDKLAGRKAIVNVSARLDPAWASLSDTNQNWLFNLLFVAAARDVNEKLDGPPLTWTTRGNVIGVGMLDAAGSLPAGSVYDRDVVDILAPGEGVPTLEDETNLACADGTSFAAAYVSAVAAILANTAPGGSTVSQIKARLLATADWKPAYSGKVKGGLVNAKRALESIDKNVLVIKRGENPPLALDVIWRDGNAFDISGVERPNTMRSNFRIQWSDVLSWDIITAPDGSESTRVTFITSGRFTALEQVAVASNLTLALDTCFVHGDSARVQCSGTRAELIKGYTAAWPGPAAIGFR